MCRLSEVPYGAKHPESSHEMFSRKSEASRVFQIAFTHAESVWTGHALSQGIHHAMAAVV